MGFEDYFRSTTNAGPAEGLDNMITGNLDYQRTLETLGKEQAFSKYMAENAYQMQAADLKAAGYNPALALGAGGASASSPSARSFNSGGGVLNAVLSLLTGLIKTSANNAVQADRISKDLSIANDKLELANDRLAFDRQVHQDINAHYLNAQAIKRDLMNQEKHSAYTAADWQRDKRRQQVYDDVDAVMRRFKALHEK